MKVLFQTNVPFAWAHGGCQVLIENVMKEVSRQCTEVEPLRWWDQEQKGDILQLFCSPREEHLYARKKGLKVVTYCFLDGFTEKGSIALLIRRYVLSFIRRYMYDIALKQGWYIGAISDAVIFPTHYEAILGQKLFGIDSRKIHVIMHGVDARYLSTTPAVGRGDYLVSIGTIDPRKNTLLLAQSAREARVPVVFVGKPYSDDERYFKEFINLIDNKYVIYKGYVTEEEKYKLLVSSRGFVTLSRFESGCIAVLEALAVGLRVLVPDLPWARGAYNGYVEFVKMSSRRRIISAIKTFYFSHIIKNKYFPVNSWKEVGKQYNDIYKKVISGQR